MPAGQGNDAEQFAAAIEYGALPDTVADAELARDLEIVAMLRSRGAEYGPRPDARVAAKQRLMQALLQQQADESAAGVSAAAGVEHPAELTAPMGGFRPLGGDAPAASAESPTAVTARMAPLTDEVLDDVARSRDARPGKPHAAQDAFDEGETAVIGGATALLGPDPADTGADEGDRGTERVIGTAGSATGSPDAGGAHTRRSRPHGRSSRPGKRRAERSTTPRGGLRRRVLFVAAAAVAVLATIAGTGTFASRDALPGDALYAMKRMSEDTGTAFTFDGQALAQRYLALATTRLTEVETLAGRPAAPDVALVEGSMADFDSATRSGATQLLGGGTAPSPAQLRDLQAWAAEQAARMSVLRSTLPAEAVPELDGSAELVDRLIDRAGAFAAREDCGEVSTSAVDDLGRLPAVGTCSPSVSAPADEATTTPESEPTPAAPEGTTDPAPSTGTTPPRTSTTSPGTSTSSPSDDGDEGGLLPPLLGGGDDEESSDQDPGSPDRDERDGGGSSGDGGNVSVPLPLLPPVNLPPLLPGLPGISIG